VTKTKLFQSDNILIRRNHEDKIGSLHITDFGVSKLFEHEETLMATTMGAGTLTYMSPEVADGSAKYNPFLADSNHFSNLITCQPFLSES
jgi:serine/threonine protein kinase